MNAKLLLDENISPKVAEALREDGVDAVGVRDRGLLEASDAVVFKRAFDEDRIVVTKNIGDFEKLAQTSDLHCGVVLLEKGDMLRDEQLATIRSAVAAIARRGDMINTVLWVATDGVMTFADLSSAGDR